MADDPQTEEQSEGQGAGSSRKGRAAEETSRFSVERLLGGDGASVVRAAYGEDDRPEGADSVGTIAGALHGLKPEKELSHSEVRSRVEKFLSHKDTTTAEDEE